MIEIPPTLEFCLAVAYLSWGDVIWAIENGIFGWRDVQEFAVANTIEKPILQQRGIPIEFHP